MVAEAKIAGGLEEAHLVGHNNLANTLALGAHYHLHLDGEARDPKTPNFLLVGTKAYLLGKLNRVVLVVQYERDCPSKNW